MRQRPPARALPERATHLDAAAIAELHGWLANTIHEHVLQALAISLMQVELSRRLCMAGQQAEAAAELETAMTQMQAAADVLHQVMRELSTNGSVLLPA